jgi:hypothetical protein
MRLKVNSLFAACFLLAVYVAYTSTLKMEAVCSTETSVNVYRATVVCRESTLLMPLKFTFKKTAPITVTALTEFHV